MNEVLKLLNTRKSIRVFEDIDISLMDKEAILEAAIQAPTAGNQSLYTILDIEKQEIKDQLALLCDNQPFMLKRKWF